MKIHEYKEYLRQQEKANFEGGRSATGFDYMLMRNIIEKVIKLNQYSTISMIESELEKHDM